MCFNFRECDAFLAVRRLRLADQRSLICRARGSRSRKRQAQETRANRGSWSFTMTSSPSSPILQPPSTSHQLGVAGLMGAMGWERRTSRTRTADRRGHGGSSETACSSISSCPLSARTPKRLRASRRRRSTPAQWKGGNVKPFGSSRVLSSFASADATADEPHPTRAQARRDGRREANQSNVTDAHDELAG